MIIEDMREGKKEIPLRYFQEGEHFVSSPHNNVFRLLKKYNDCDDWMCLDEVESKVRYIYKDTNVEAIKAKLVIY